MGGPSTWETHQSSEFILSIKRYITNRILLVQTKKKKKKGYSISEYDKETVYLLEYNNLYKLNLETRDSIKGSI